MDIEPADEGPHEGCIDEWWFGWWRPDGVAGLCGHRADERARTLGYWWVWRVPDEPLLHISDWNVRMRSSSGLVKGELLWAEHLCESPHRQWTVSNESRAAAVDDPIEIARTGFGVPTPVASDLEWYATASAASFDSGTGYQQVGVMHGVVEVLGRPTIEIEEVSAWRCHRWWPIGSEPSGGLFPRRSAQQVDAVISGPDRSYVTLGLTADGWVEVSSPSTDHGA